MTSAETFHISIGAVVGAILMLAALLLYGIGIIYFPFVAPPSGSPYVRGGSIRGVTNPSMDQMRRDCLRCRIRILDNSY